MAAVDVTDDDFDTVIGESAVPVVVDFWAEWCGPCKQMSPHIDAVSEELAGQIKVAKVNVDENPQVTAAMGIRGIPALFLVKDGQIVANKVGAAPKAALQSWIDDSI